MNLSPINIALSGLLALVVISSWMIRVDYTRPNFEILPDMKYSTAWNAYEPNPHFPNGRTLQPPVLGTIARGEVPLYYKATKEDAIRAGEKLINPFSQDIIEPEEQSISSDKNLESSENLQDPKEAVIATAIDRKQASVARGQELYRIFCNCCHGATGKGDGMVPQRGFPPPTSMLTGKSVQMKDGQLFHILTYGQGSMPEMATQVSLDERWDLINYVRTLQANAPPIEIAPEKESASKHDGGKTE
ncbi:MAG: c-type cytochrome [Pirellulales bacterium]